MKPVAAAVAIALMLAIDVLTPTSARAQADSADAQDDLTATAVAEWQSGKTIEEVSAICVSAFELAAAEDDPDLTWAIKSCASLDDWVTASAAYPDALSGPEPLGVVVSMCVDESLGLAPYTLCHDVRTSLVGGSSAGGFNETELRAACQTRAANRTAFDACLEIMRSTLASDSAAEAYLVVAAADRDARQEASALLKAAGRDRKARASAWAANAARNEAFVASVAALDLPPAAKPLLDKLLSRSRLVASLERMLSRVLGDSGLYRRWQTAVDARRMAALEMRRVLGIPDADAGPAELASRIYVDLVIRSAGFRSRVKRDLPGGLMTWCEWGARPGRGGGSFAKWVVLGGEDLGVPSLSSFSFQDPDGPGRTGGVVLVDIARGLDTGTYSWDPDGVLQAGPREKARYRGSGRTVSFDIKPAKILQQGSRLVVKGAITCEASTTDLGS